MKKIAWCVPLSFVIAVIFLLGNAASAQAATICGWTAISVGTNEYVYTWSCYDNGGVEGREDIKYGTRPGSNNPRDGGGGGNGAAQDTAEKITGVIKKAKDLCRKPSEKCEVWGQRMTLPQPAGSGFCTNISAALPLIGTAVCINTVNAEVNLNDCANVGCP
jgi:hypothetical protein